MLIEPNRPLYVRCDVDRSLIRSLDREEEEELLNCLLGAGLGKYSSAIRNSQDNALARAIVNLCVTMVDGDKNVPQRDSRPNEQRFTEQLRLVLRMAREEAYDLNHDWVGTEHLLLGIIAEGNDIASIAILRLNVDPGAIGRTIKESIKRGPEIRKKIEVIPYTSRAKKVIELAMLAARDMNSEYVGTEHLLLGLIREKDGLAAEVLGKAGVTLDGTRDEITRILAQG